jgi:hypothetical protein
MREIELFRKSLRHLQMMLERRKGLAGLVLQLRVFATLRVALEQ